MTKSNLKVVNSPKELDKDKQKALEAARQNNNCEGSFILQEGGILEPGELNFYVKNSNKKNRSPMLALTTSAPSDDGEDENWGQVLALLKVLESYGCLAKEAESGDNTDSSLENNTYSVSSGGTHVGSLGMDNSLWTITALGGAFDVAYDSAELDKFQDSLSFLGLDDDDDDFGQDEIEENSDDYSNIPKPQKESEKLVRDLCNLSASEMAGFVSALVVDAPRQSDSAIASFQKLETSNVNIL